jgi:hypothetical protein
MPTAPLAHPWDGQWPVPMSGFTGPLFLQQHANPPPLLSLLLLGQGSSLTGGQVPSLCQNLLDALGISSWQNRLPFPQPQASTINQDLHLLLQIQDALQCLQQRAVPREGQTLPMALLQAFQGMQPGAVSGAGVYPPAMPAAMPTGWPVGDAASLYWRQFAAPTRWDANSGRIENQGLGLLQKPGQQQAFMPRSWSGSSQQPAFEQNIGHMWNALPSCSVQVPTMERADTGLELVEAHKVMPGRHGEMPRQSNMPSATSIRIINAVGYLLASSLPVGTLHGIPASREIVLGRLVLLIAVSGDGRHDFICRLSE